MANTHTTIHRQPDLIAMSVILLYNCHNGIQHHMPSAQATKFSSSSRLVNDHIDYTPAAVGSDKLVMACTSSGPCTPRMVCFSMPPCKQSHHTDTGRIVAQGGVVVKPQASFGGCSAARLQWTSCSCIGHLPAAQEAWSGGRQLAAATAASCTL